MERHKKTMLLGFIKPLPHHTNKMLMHIYKVLTSMYRNWIQSIIHLSDLMLTICQRKTRKYLEKRPIFTYYFHVQVLNFLCYLYVEILRKISHFTSTCIILWYTTHMGKLSLTARFHEVRNWLIAAVAWHIVHYAYLGCRDVTTIQTIPLLFAINTFSSSSATRRSSLKIRK